MSLLTQIKKDMFLAKKESQGDIKKTILATLFAEAASVGKNAGNRESTDEEVLKVIQKFVKNNNETIKLCKGDNTKYKQEFQAYAENKILEEYLPKQLTEEELTTIVQSIITEVGATTPKQMGLVMKTLKSNHDGTYDGKTASMIVKRELGK